MGFRSFNGMAGKVPLCGPLDSSACKGGAGNVVSFLPQAACKLLRPSRFAIKAASSASSKTQSQSLPVPNVASPIDTDIRVVDA